jgi:hypothetical protein
MDENWAATIPMLTKTLRSDGDCGGLMLLADSGAWLVIQLQPVDIGVFAFSIDNDIGRRMPEVSDCFFSCSDIQEWLAGSSEHGVALRESVGAEFLAGLVRSYCCKNGSGDVVSADIATRA